LNGGTIFFNDGNIDNVKKFVELWKTKCDKWQNKAWWLDQVELVRIFSEADVRFRNGFDSTAILHSGDSAIRLRTFPWNIYNFYPGAGYEKPRNTGKVKIVHLKSRKRKRLFNILPKVLVDLWFQNFGRRIFGPLCDLLFCGILNAAKAKDLLHRKYLAMKYERGSEIHYWKVAAIRKRPLYDFAYFRANEIMKIFYELNGFEELDNGQRVVDIGPGPCGGVLDVLDAKEKWAVEPGFEEYKKNNIWMAKSTDLTVRNTTAEDMSDVPEDYFDSVFAINSIDHGDDIRCCFDNVYRVLKAGGRFFLHVHCRRQGELNPLHRQSFSENVLKQMLEESGFTIYTYRFYDEDPLSSTYNTFIGICRKAKG
jgi:SAM-dependent methyltransferase